MSGLHRGYIMLLSRVRKTLNRRATFSGYLFFDGFQLALFVNGGSVPSYLRTQNTVKSARPRQPLLLLFFSDQERCGKKRHGGKKKTLKKQIPLNHKSQGCLFVQHVCVWPIMADNLRWIFWLYKLADVAVMRGIRITDVLCSYYKKLLEVPR